MFSLCLCDMGGCRVQGVDWQSPASSPLFTGLNFTKVKEDLSGSCGENSLKVKHVDIKAFFLSDGISKHSKHFVCVCVHVRMCAHVSTVGNVLAKLWPHMVSTITELQRLLTYLLSSSEENHLARSTEFLLDRILQTSGELRKMKREMKMN